MIYLTGVSNPSTRGCARSDLGVLVQPDTAQYLNHLADYGSWAADNAFYGLGAKADPTPEQERDAIARWLEFVDQVPAEAKATCLFVTVPDVLRWIEVDGARIPVGDAEATLERFARLAPELAGKGLPVALVAQDGLENLEVPWDDFDVLFLGGSTEWKLSPASRSLVMQAKARGKRVHMGRVNSYKRLRIAYGWACDTADGTYLRFTGPKGLPTIVSWLDRLQRNGYQPELAEAVA